MKKIFMILLITILLVSVAFAVTGEQVAMLPNGKAASDSFDGSLDSDRWSLEDPYGKISYEYPDIVFDESNTHRYIVQPYDYNDGALKSSYYRFEAVFRSHLSDGYDNAALTLLDDKNNIFSGYYDNAVSFYNKNTYLDISSNYISKRKNTRSKFDYKFVIEMTRQGTSNTFDVTQKIYIDGSLFETYSGVRTQEHIYPALWSYSGYRTRIKDFKAYVVPMSSDSINIDNVKQDGTSVELTYSMPVDYPNVKVVYGTNSNLSFDNDTVLYNGSSTLPVTFNLPTENDFYIGIMGYGTSTETMPDIVKFEPISPVSKLSYSHNTDDKSYTFTWPEITDATEYVIVKGTTTVLRTNSNRSVSFDDVNSPESVYIIAKKDAYASGDSISESVNAELGDLGAVQNLTYTMNGNMINLNWDDMNGAENYFVVRDYGNNNFVSLGQNTLSEFETSLNSHNVVSNYKVKAFVNDVYSDYSNIVTIKNQVKGLTSTITDKVELSWTGIGDADSYKIYVSDHSNMSSPTTYTSTVSNYDLTFDVSDTGIKYIQVEAIKGSYTSLLSDVYEVDLSFNQTVSNYTINYTANSDVVNLDWDDLSAADEYKVLISKDGLTYNELTRVTASAYNYMILTSDPNELYFKIQPVASFGDLRISEVKQTETFTKDKVIGLVATKVSDKIALDWSDLPRADKYYVEASNFDDMSSSTTYSTNDADYLYTILAADSTTKYFRVRAYKNNELLYSTFSSITSSDANDAVDINIDEDLSVKHYGEAIDLDVKFKINEAALYEPEVTIDLNHIMYPGSSTAMISYVYPEIGDILLYSGSTPLTGISLEYFTTIKSTNDGFKISIKFTNADIETLLTQGRTISIPIKTDVAFANVSGTQSILYKGPSDYITWMELPFVVETQFSNLLSRIGAVEADVLDEMQFSPKLIYKTSPIAGETAVSAPQIYRFVNRQKLPSQN